MFQKLRSPAPISLDWAALLLRIAFCGLMVYNHSLMNMEIVLESPESSPDPLGIGGTLSYYLVILPKPCSRYWYCSVCLPALR